MFQIDIMVEMTMDDEEEKLTFLEKKKDTFVTPNHKNRIVIEREDGIAAGRIKLKECEERYKRYCEQILALFEAKYHQAINAQQENYESGFEPEEDGETEEDIKVPYDPQLITVAPAKFSLKEVVSMIQGEEDEEPVLDLAPVFQREYVWDNVRKSRLIESILLNIPLPMFYLARDKDGKLQVVDGVQRLTTIYKYFNNEFKLSNLEYLTNECEGRYFKKGSLPEDKSLRPKLVRALRQYQIDCNIIEPSTPENVKLDIFKRLNTGGKELNKQEVRHAFMKKDVRNFIKKIVETEEFKMATNNSVNDKRMMAQELILRYIGFYCLFIDNFLQVDYVSKMDDFLDDVAIELNKCKRIPYDEVQDAFTDSMKKAVIMFGNSAFRKVDVDENGMMTNKKYPVNKSLFIAFSIALADIPMEKVVQGGNIIVDFARHLNWDEQFHYSISHNTNYQLKGTAVDKVRDFLKNIYS